jgi:hypothetical protein
VKILQKAAVDLIRGSGISSSLSLISVICYLLSLVYRAGGFVMIISLHPIPACPPWVRPAVHRHGKPNACQIPARPGPKAERPKFLHRNDDSADPNAAPNGGGRLSVNIASTFGKPKNRSVREDLDFRSGRPRLSFGKTSTFVREDLDFPSGHHVSSPCRRTPTQTQMARPSRHARFRRNRRPMARPHALWSRTFRPRVRQNPA